jgi:hypothetical protein
MSRGDKYLKIVEWSEEDQCFIGSCPELFYGGCHGNREILFECVEQLPDGILAVFLRIQRESSRLDHLKIPIDGSGRNSHLLSEVCSADTASVTLHEPYYFPLTCNLSSTHVRFRPSSST